MDREMIDPLHAFLLILILVLLLVLPENALTLKQQPSCQNCVNLCFEENREQARIACSYAEKGERNPAIYQLLDCLKGNELAKTGRKILVANPAITFETLLTKCGEEPALQAECTLNQIIINADGRVVLSNISDNFTGKGYTKLDARKAAQQACEDKFSKACQIIECRYKFAPPASP